MSKYKALIIDDEPDICELLQITLQPMNIESVTAENLEQARQYVDEQNFDLCLCDMNLPDGNGIDFVRHIHQHHNQLPIAIITAHGNMESAIEALKAGAFDFISKPVDLSTLRNLVSSALKLKTPTTNKQKTSQLEKILLGNSIPITAVREKIIKLARSQAPVYISGESGTGKELVARLIHDNGPRAEKPFIPVNCGAIPEDLIESEFFGHLKGSFTGATSNKEGLFQAANQGTLFLDEVADLPLHLQVKLLRAIQEKAVRPVGAQTEMPIDVRILSATHKNLSSLIKEGSFRQDLFYRINVIELQLPSLRARPEDIPLLAQHILNKLIQQDPSSTHVFSDTALQALERYPFPGNVRELENILERATTLCENTTILEEDLHLPETSDTHPELPSAEQTGETALEPFLNSIEKDAIVNALKQTNHNRTAAAKLLGITYRAMRYKLKKLGLD